MAVGGARTGMSPIKHNSLQCRLASLFRRVGGKGGLKRAGAIHTWEGPRQAVVHLARQSCFYGRSHGNTPRDRSGYVNSLFSSEP